MTVRKQPDATLNKMSIAQIREAEKKSVGRPWKTADRLETTEFSDGIRNDFWWNDGAVVSVFHDDKEEAMREATRLGFIVKKNPSSRVTAKRNLAKKRTIGQKSQRGRRDPRTGRFTQKASSRLMARRKKDTVPGYFPNPGEELFFPNPAADNAASMLNRNIREYIRKIPREHGAEKQACVSFTQGLIEAGHIVGIFNHDEKKTWLSLLKTSIG